MRHLFRTRKRKVALVLALLALSSGTALAAFLIYSGASGSGSAHIATASTVGAITISGQGNPELVPGEATGQLFQLVNNDADAYHDLGTIAATVTANPSTCGQYVALDTAALAGFRVLAGATTSRSLTWTTNAATPASCSAATISVSFTGSTSP